MAINSTGRRVLVNKGIYDSTLQYYPMDAVYYGGEVSHAGKRFQTSCY